MGSLGRLTGIPALFFVAFFTLPFAPFPGNLKQGSRTGAQGQYPPEEKHQDQTGKLQQGSDCPDRIANEPLRVVEHKN